MSFISLKGSIFPRIRAERLLCLSAIKCAGQERWRLKQRRLAKQDVMLIEDDDPAPRQALKN